MSLCAQNSATNRVETERSRFDAEDSAKTIGLTVSEEEWKAAVMKTFLAGAVRPILALKGVCRADIN